MADLEELTIRITQESSQATQGIEKLAARLNALSHAVGGLEVGNLNILASGLTNLNTAIAQINATSTKRDYNKIVSNLSTLSQVNIGNLDALSASIRTLSDSFSQLSAASGITESVRNLITAISRLGGASVTRAITNIPLLQNALTNLITSFSTLPNINQNILDFINSLTNLASQGTRMGTATNAVRNSLENFGNTTNRVRHRALNLASAIGMLYARFWILLRGVRSLRSAFKEAADYLEAFNFFDVVAEKIGADTFRREGVGNADEYAEAFMSEMQKKLHQMSGLELDLEDRLIKTTNAKSLGLNLTEITQYQASIASLTNAMHLTQEVSTATSKALSMLAADMGSLKNLDYSQVAQNLQSGLTGMARSLYKYGIDITQATLEQYAFNEGLTKSVSEMTQAEKAQLRLLAILDQSKVAWGDLANTINSPSNQLRQLKNNMKEIGVVAGQLMIPMVTRTLTVLNGLSIAIKRLLVDIAQILGISLNLDEFGSGFSDSLEEDVDALDDFNKTLKETKKGIREFDELKVIGGSKDDSLTGIGDEIDLTQQILAATAEYEKVWDEAYEKMKSKAEEIANLITPALEPIKKIVEDFAIGDFFTAGQDISELVAGIFNFVADAINAVDWDALGERIGDLLSGINWGAVFTGFGNLVGSAIQAAINIWHGAFDVAPYETAIITAFAVLRFTRLGQALTTNIGNAVRNWFVNHGVDQQFLTRAGLGAVSIGLGVAFTIQNVTSVQTGQYAALSAQSLIKSAVSSLLIGAGAASVATALGLGHAGIIFAVAFGVSMALNVIAAVLSEPDENTARDLAEQEYAWVHDSHLDTLEVMANIQLKAGEIDTQFLQIDTLADKVYELSLNYDKLTDGEKDLLKYYSEELIKVMPELANSIDKVTGAYRGTREELEKLMDAQKNQIAQEAYREALLETEKQRGKVQAQYDKAHAEWKAASEEYKEILAQARLWGYTDAEFLQIALASDDDAYDLLHNQSVAHQMLADDIRRVSANLNASSQAESILKGDLDALNEQYNTYFNLFEETVKTSMDNQTQAFDDASKKIKNSKLPSAVKTTLDKVDQKIQKGDKITTADMKEMRDNINNSFEGLGDGKVPAEIEETLNSVEQAIKDKSPDLILLMAQLASQMESAFSNALTISLEDSIDYKPVALGNKLGNIRSAAYNNAQVDKSDITKLVYDAFTSVGAKSTPTNVVAKIQDLINADSNESILKAVSSLEDELKIEFAKLGYNLDIGWAQGIHDGSKFVFEAITDVSEGSLETFQNENEEHSPSALYRREALNIPLGIALGIMDGLPKIDTAMEGLTESMTSDFGQLKYNVPKLDIGTNRTSYYGSVTPSREDSFLSQLARVTRDNNGQTEVVFRIEGDPHGMFRVMREQGDVYRRRTGRSAF